MSGLAEDWTYAPLYDGTMLYPHQRDAARWMVDGRVRLLAAKPRMGKTLTALSAANAMLGDTGGNMVIVCPAGLQEQWRANIARWALPGYSKFVISYNSLAADKTQGMPAAIDILVIDESHFTKSKDAIRTKKLYGEYCRTGGFVQRAKVIYLLTGTPMTAGPQDLWPMLRRLCPDTIVGPTGRPKSLHDFIDTYCSTMQTGFGRKIVGGRRLPELKVLMSAFTLTQGYDLLPLDQVPPPTDIITVEVSKSAIREIEEFDFSPEGRAVRHALATGGVAALSKLGTHASTLRRLLGLAKIDPTVSLVDAYLEADPDLKVVVFAVHTEVAVALKKRFAKHGAVAFVGGMNAAEQAKVKASLNYDPKCRVIVASLIAAAEGHDFSAAAMSIRCESAWTPSANAQADARIWRADKRRPIVLQALVIKGSVDEDVMRVVEAKAAMARRVFGS